MSTDSARSSEGTTAPRRTSVARQMRLSGEGEPVTGECAPWFDMGRFAWASFAGMEEDVR
jgi:hypothetical protein